MIVYYMFTFIFIYIVYYIIAKVDAIVIMAVVPAYCPDPAVRIFQDERNATFGFHIGGPYLGWNYGDKF